MDMTVTVDGERFGYSEFGGGGTTVVLLHATLMRRSMQRPLAEHLASKGYHVVTLDLIGVPVDGAYDAARFGSDRVAFRMLEILDALGIEEFVVGGSSVGSVVAMEIALRAPERVLALVLEGPFLENGTGFAAYLWSPGLLLFTLGWPVLAPVAALARRLPRGGSATRSMLLDLVGQDPKAVVAWMRGMFYGRMGPASDERRLIQNPTLIFGFPRDPFHPMKDARQLAQEIPHARTHFGGSIADLRLRPDKLAGVITEFLGNLEPAGPRAGQRRRQA